MKKQILGTIIGLLSTAALADNSTFLQQFYPYDAHNKCYVMEKGTESYSNICVQDIISKDFSQSGGNIYKVVRSGEAYGGIHAAPGIVDLYAYSPSGTLIAKHREEIGTFGYPPSEWKFKKKKNGKEEINTEECVTGQGITECTKISFSLKGNKFVISKR